MSKVDLKLQDVTIAVVTVLSHEHIAVRAIFDCTPSPIIAPGEPGPLRLTYFLARIPSVLGGDNVVAAVRLAQMGTNSAAFCVPRILNDCPNLKHVIMCGIAGAVPNPRDAANHVRLGDIVVLGKEGVIQHDFGKDTPDGLQPRPLPRPPGPVLLRAVNDLEDVITQGSYPWEGRINTFIDEYGAVWARPPDSADMLYDTDDPTLVISHPADVDRRAGAPRIFVGAIASGNVVIKNAKRRDAVREQCRALAFEMEGSGIADATYNLGLSFLIVRGTCDYCDAAKNDVWQKYSAVSAAAYTRCVVEFLPGARADVSLQLSGVTLPEDTADQETLRVESPEAVQRLGAEVAALIAEGDSGDRSELQRRSIPADSTTLARVLERAGQLKRAIEENLNVLEVEKATQCGQELEELLRASGDSLPSERQSDLYLLLAQLAIQPNSSSGPEARLARARAFLERARNA